MRTILLILAAIIAPQESDIQSSIWHLRKPDGYGVKSHTIYEEFDVGSDIRKIGEPVFSVDLTEPVFQKKKKWDGKNYKAIEISKSVVFRSMQRLMSDGKVLVSKPNSTWQIQRVFLQTVDEEKGDYVWVAIVNRQQSGGATFIPRFPIYFSLEGEYLAAIPIEKGDKAFKSCFTESSE